MFSSVPPADLPRERDGHPAPPNLAARREGLKAAIAAGTWNTNPKPKELMIGGVRALRFSPSGNEQGIVLHIHGGAFRIGCPETVALFAAELARRCNVAVICPAYRLAPEHPFPAGLNDGYSVLRTLMAEGKDRILLSGDSAGGALATGLAALAVTDGLPIRGLALLSPWLDLTVESASYGINEGKDPLFSRAAAEEAAALYLQGLRPIHPMASPLFASVNGFPPTYISVGGGEVLVDDARRFRKNLLAAKIPVKLEIIEGMEHVAVTRNFALLGAQQTFQSLADFIAKRITSE